MRLLVSEQSRLNRRKQRSHRLQMLNQLVVLRMRANPEPVDMICLSQSHGPVADTDTDRVDWLPLVDPLELETRMVGI